MEDMVKNFGGVYAGLRALVTGHTGFKGGWLSLWLKALGAEVSGLSLPPPSGPALFPILPHETFLHSWLRDLREPGAIEEAIRTSRPDIIFHLAAQPLVGRSYSEPLETLTTNTLGTALLLEAVRAAASPAAVVVVTSDKCYRNRNGGRPFREDDPLGGHDPYSMSKAAAELVVAAWHASFFASNPRLGPLATARAGNVIGGGDYAEDRILPDAVRAFEGRRPLVLRRPESTRPWQHILESASGYLALGQRLLQRPELGRLLSFNFGPDPAAECTVRKLIESWLAAWPDAFKVEVAPRATYAEAGRLRLDHSIAITELGWKPVWTLEQTVAHTAAWYRRRHEKRVHDAGMLEFSLEQIAAYAADAKIAGVAWSTTVSSA